MFTIFVTGNNFMRPESIAGEIAERYGSKYALDVRTLRFENVPAPAFPVYDETLVPSGMSIEDPNVPKAPCAGIREYYGDPLALLGKLDDVDMLVMYGNGLPRTVIESAPRLKCVVAMRGGPVNVDRACLEERGIPLHNTPGRNATGVAELTIGMLLNLMRHLCELNHSLKAGVWTLKYNRYETVGTELHGKRVGLIGFGKIARHLCRILNGFESEVVVFDPFVAEAEVRAAGAAPQPLAELLKTSDIVSLHARINRGDPPIVGAQELAMMKPTAILANTARGMLLDYRALKDSLERGEIGGAVLDVYGDEPFKLYREIVALPNVFGTSHTGGVTKEAAMRGTRQTVKLVGELLEKYAAP